MTCRGRVLIAVVAGCLAVWAGIIALSYVLASHGETALLAAGCALYAGIVGWNWKQHSKGASKC